MKFYPILYQGPGTRTTLNVCKHATASLRTQHNLATNLGWTLPLSAVLPHSWFTINFFSRSTDNSITPKSFWFFHRTAVGITVHLGYGPTVYYSRRLTARAHLFWCLLASYMLLSSSPSQEQSAVQESVFIWRKAKNIRKVKPSFSEKATFCQTSFSPLALPKFLEKKTTFLTSLHQPYHLLLHNLTQGWST